MPDEMDNILDHALAAYTVAQPRLGFERRVLARVRSTTPWRGIFFGAAVMASLSIALLIRPPVHPVRTAPALPLSVVRIPLINVARQSSAVPTDRRAIQARALLQFAREAPEMALALARPDKPLEVDPIKIEPLQIDALPTGDPQ